ncbi:toll-like receptor 13 [Scleropages formosus]|nr:toll-like receptor 13 [Scleropages formosus]
MAELIPQGFSSLYQLQQLSLQANALKVITKDHFHNLTSLRQLNLNLNIISYIEDGAFKDLKNLTHLDLGGNRIHTLNSHILHGLRKLKILKLYNNHLHFEDWESPFVGLSSLEMTDLRYQGPLTTGLGNLGENFFMGLELLKCLNIGYTILTTFHPNVFARLVNLQTLYIGSVSMTNTNLTFLLRNLVSLINLSLTKVDLDSLPSNLLPPGNTLKYLKVQYNHFHVLEESLQRNLPMLQYLDVIGNPLSCNCQNAWFKNWSFLNTEVQVAFVYDLRCDNELSSPHLWEFDDKACSYDLISFTFFLSTALLDIVLLLLGLIWQKSRSTIRYLLLLIRSRLFGKKRAAQKAYTYDAFISYSSKDDAWVMGELVPHLEGPQGEGFRLCLHHRDFRPGTAIMENIETAIYSSRHTLCVVSRDFLRSEWCALEFQLASLRLLCDRSDVLLLVFLEEIPNHRLSAYTRLRKMVRRNTYLLWPEDLMEREAFWVRLRNALRSGVEDGEDQDFTKLFA